MDTANDNILGDKDYRSTNINKLNSILSLAMSRAHIYINYLGFMLPRKFHNQLWQSLRYLLIMREELPRISLSFRNINSIFAEHYHLFEESPPL
jgi:hypothetical protein